MGLEHKGDFNGGITIHSAFNPVHGGNPHGERFAFWPDSAHSIENFQRKLHAGLQVSAIFVAPLIGYW